MASHTHETTTQQEPSLDAVLGTVAPRLRALRQRRGVTLAQVADSTGISVSTLSRLESGQRRPTLDLLLPLAREYRVALDDLVGAPPTGDPRVRPQPVVRHGRTYIPLSRHADGLHAFKVIFPAPVSGAEPEKLKQGAHDGYDWIYVLTGRLRLALGDTETILEPGDAAEFDTRTPHGFASAGPGPTEVINLLSQQGERIHLREV